MKAKRMIGGVLLAVVLAFGMTRTVGAVAPKPNAPVSYCEYAWWVIECWFVN